MIIIAGHELVAAEDRDAFVAAFDDMVSRARDFDGCIDIAITADSLDPERINLVEVWRDAEALNKWRRRAKGPRLKKPKLVAIRRYDATDSGSPF
jgi:quinol monooxygenase YgiN